ncbi:hypothetical protein EBU24_06550 [bacterium]|nr:hypothetical protein [bacterium]
MNVKWDITLRADQLPNPIIEHSIELLPSNLINPSVEDLKKVFNTGKQSLKTWGRTSGVINGTEPHWIGVFKQTPLHTDPAYPRYTHHLILKADAFVLRGHNKIELPIFRGTYILLDTHSPHQLFALNKDACWYFAVSMDSKIKLPKSETLPKLINYALNAPLLTPEILVQNNGGRF